MKMAALLAFSGTDVKRSAHSSVPVATVTENMAFVTADLESLGPHATSPAQCPPMGPAVWRSVTATLRTLRAVMLRPANATVSQATPETAVSRSARTTSTARTVRGNVTVLTTPSVTMSPDPV